MSHRRIVSSGISNFDVNVPGSKYLANRYIAIAALVDGDTTLHNVPVNDDIDAALRAIEALGATVTVTGSQVIIQGIKDYSSDHLIHLNCRDSGTLSRFVTALSANMYSPVFIDASEQMKQRPMQEIVDCLELLGVSVSSNQGYLPLTVTGPIQGGICQLDASRSSQFLSALLIACLRAEKETLIQLTGELVSESYIELTLKAIQKFTGNIGRINGKEFLIEPQQKLQANTIHVASDVVSCSYFMAAALIAETSTCIKHYDFDSVQGEAQFPHVLELMGAHVERQQDDLLISYNKPLVGIEVDMGNMPDAVPTLTVIAAFASGETHITNIAHLAFKESNRIVDLCEQLKQVGVQCEYGEDYIKIIGSNKLHAAKVSSCHDHRLAMSLALLGIKIPNLVIKDAQAVEKSFPQYWQYLEQIGIVTEEIE
ncbi:MAG: 3-phosphoshikimate 1-carboxyvinyltransferase [Kangiellaceae bacterium]|nr:3-phosphoshikimate 1-carboxyvinyltransferase [Kangiellaceae bacterium]